MTELLDVGAPAPLAPAPRVALVAAASAPLLARDLFASGNPGPIAASLAQVPELLGPTLPF
jgi:hypothetical protein